ncbi:MAG: 2-amino-4-hydroxy-6-hydroxymethyldihydropteridine diphosphokinase [Betaproteobacteria bacterium]|nr:2-amino-4-hydroxy-6-hydroxymethyldihydropteridine diphosphokinase [Betaproteobacteria bacterium]
MAACHRAFIALGSNLDNPREQVRRALAALAALPDSRQLRASSLYLTEPVGIMDQPTFINAVAALDTTSDPETLFWRLRDIEAAQGRSRGVPNGPRTLDLDLLLFDDLALDSPALTLPHPRMHQRAFVLVPLAELAPDAVIPGLGSVGHCLENVGREGVRLAT